MAQCNSIEDVTVKRVIGSGRYGIVSLAKDKSTGMAYAMKSVRGDFEETAEQHTATELLKKEAYLMGLLDTPFVARLVSLFRGSSACHMLTELCTGGDLLIALNRLGGVFSKADSQFYLAAVLLGVKCCHEASIICRDIKPENVLLDACGYPKHVDFSESRLLPSDGRCKTIVGTPQYVAPEVILGRDYGFAADIWSIGVMGFEMLCGYMPFDMDDFDEPQQIFRRIILGTLTIGSVQDKDTSRLLKGLLSKHPEDRLGCSDASGAQAIMKHSFFDGFDWDGLCGRELEPPFVSSCELFLTEADY